MFENLIKITRHKGNVESNNNEIKLPAFSNDFITIKAVKSENLKDFLDALKNFNGKLNQLVADLYRNEKNINLCKEYEEIISELSRKEAQIKYLSSYSESMQLKIEAFEKLLDEKEATLNKLEDKKIVTVNKIINLKKNVQKNKSKPAKKLALPWRSGFQIRERQQNENVTLHLSANNNQNNDWMDLE